MKFIKIFEEVIQDNKFKEKLKILDNEFEEFLNDSVSENYTEEIINNIEDKKLKSLFINLYNFSNNVLLSNDTYNYWKYNKDVEKFLNSTKIKSLKDFISFFNIIKKYSSSELLNRHLIKTIFKTNDMKYLKYIFSGLEGAVYQITPNLVCKIFNSDLNTNILDKLIINPLEGVVNIKSYKKYGNVYLIIMEKLYPVDKINKNNLSDCYTLSKNFYDLYIRKFPENMIFYNIHFGFIYDLIYENDIENKNKLLKYFKDIGKEKLFEMISQIIKIIENLISINVYNSDMHENNFMLDKNRKLTLIDIASKYTNEL